MISPPEYRSLNEAKILETLERLRDRIGERFPDSGLKRVSEEFLAVGGEVSQTVDYLRAPNWPIRILAGVAIVAMVTVLGVGLATLPLVPVGVGWLADAAGAAAAVDGSAALMSTKSRLSTLVPTELPAGVT